MEVDYEKTNNRKRLTLRCTTEEEHRILVTFARELEPFTGELRYSPGWRRPEIILTNE